MRSSGDFSYGRLPTETGLYHDDDYAHCGAAGAGDVHTGHKNLDLGVQGEVLVAIKGKAVTALVRATDANLGLARGVIDRKEK